MRVVKAKAMGMCFGVKRALEVLKKIPDPSRVTIHGDLVHNEQILDDLKKRGFAMIDENARYEIPSTPIVLITAHGISERERKRLIDARKELIDTTCPLVRQVHRSARELEAEGCHVLVIGKPGHVEVRGIVGDLERFTVVQKPEDIRPCPASSIGVVCQTTTPPDTALEMAAAIRAANPRKAIRLIDTICNPTRLRQKAARDLMPQIDALVVVGGSRSNNTLQLVRMAEQHGLEAFHIASAEELNPYRLFSYETIGLTAGTSTPDGTIDAVYHRLLSIAGMKQSAIIRSA